jgi:hypothetical protein
MTLTKPASSLVGHRSGWTPGPGAYLWYRQTVSSTVDSLSILSFCQTIFKCRFLFFVACYMHTLFSHQLCMMIEALFGSSHLNFSDSHF